MCSIAQTSAGSIAGQSPNSTMLGGSAIGSNYTGTKRMAAGLVSTMLGQSGGGGSSPERGTNTGGGLPRSGSTRPLMTQE